MTRVLASSSVRLMQTTTARELQSEWSVASLTSAMKQLDENAYREFFQRYYKRLFAYLINVANGDYRLIEDSLQAAFQKIVAHIKVFEDEQALWNWICQISRNCLLDSYRREGVRSRTLERLFATFEPEKENTPVSQQTSIRLQLLENSINLLPEEERSLIQSKYLDGLTYAEIAHRVDTTEKAVESKLARIRKKLRNLMGKESKP